jgi:beta-lactam-binding protein with PASTA domain
LVPVPNVEGMPADEAQRRLEQAGLSVLVEEREEPGTEKGTILEQSREPGALVPPDSEITIVVSSPGRELTMYNVVGLSMEVVRNGLEQDGLQIHVEEKWSTQPKGMVMAQEPEPGTKLHAGDAVTLTVSGNIEVPIPLEVNLDDKFVLKNAELRQETFRPDGAIAVTLRWEALRSTSTHYVVFVHLVDDPHAPALAQQDVEPFTPTTEWEPGIEVVDPHQVTIPANLPAGRYQLRVGMYPQGKPNYQLPVLDTGFTTVESGRILITEIEIQP